MERDDEVLQVMAKHCKRLGGKERLLHHLKQRCKVRVGMSWICVEE